MSIRVDLSDGLDIATDHVFEYEVLDANDQPIDASTWSLSWMLKRSLKDADASALVNRTNGNGITITGTFNVDRAVNTQRVAVTVLSINTVNLEPATQSEYELKRMDVGLETVLVKGTCPLNRTVHRT
jgi:hypothetical protein